LIPYGKKQRQAALLVQGGFFCAVFRSVRENDASACNRLLFCDNATPEIILFCYNTLQDIVFFLSILMESGMLLMH
jgi:hypothetical protein